MATPNEEWSAHEVTSVLYTLELGPGHAPVTFVPERPGEEVDREAMQSVSPTGYVTPYADMASLNTAMIAEPLDPFLFTSSFSRVAYEEGGPVYLIGSRTPELLRDLNPTQVREISLLPDFLALGAFSLAVGHFVMPRTRETQTRRDVLKGSALALAGAALYMAFGPTGDGKKYDDIAEELTSYTEADQETMVNWYKLLRGFSNLIMARKIHEISRLQGSAYGAHLLALVPAQNDGLRAALLMPADVRDELVLHLIQEVMTPLVERGLLDQDDYGSLLGEMAHYIEAVPVAGSEEPLWEGTLHQVVSFAEPSE